MGFDLGAALGSAVNTGVNTYTKLQENERLAAAELRAIEAEKRTAEQFDWQRREQAGKQASEEAYLATLGNPSQFKEQVIPGTEGVGEEGPAIKREAIPYSEQQKNADFQSRLRETKGSVLHGMQLQQSGLGIKGLQRTEERAAAEDQLSKEHQEAVTLATKDPVAWATQNLDAYNKAAKGSHLDDGLTAKIVPSADGGASFVRTDKNGKVKDSTPITTQTALEAMKDVFYAKYQALPGKFKEGAELGLANENVKLKGREVAAKEALVPSEMAKNFGAAYASGEAGKYYGVHAKTIGDENARKQDIYNTQKLYADKIASLDPKAPDYATRKFELAQQGEAALAMKSGDFSKIQAGTPMGRAMTSYHEAEKAYNEGKTAVRPNQASFIASAGFASEGVQNDFKTRYEAALAGNKPKEAAAIANEYRSKYQYTPIDFPGAPAFVEQTSAAPAGNKGYTPEPNSPAAKAATKREAAIAVRNKDKEERAAKVKSMAESAFNPSTQFDVDKSTMPKEALVRKYTPLQRALTSEQFDYLNQ